MLRIEVLTQEKRIGRIDILNKAKRCGKKTIYSVTYKLPNDLCIDFEVKHTRSEGAIKLLAIVSNKLVKEIDKFFSLPEDKIEKGAIRCKDIPERFKNAFSKYSPINTGTMLGDDMALFVSDIEGWLNMMKTGVCPLWD